MILKEIWGSHTSINMEVFWQHCYIYIYIYIYKYDDDVIKLRHFPLYWPLKGNSLAIGDFPAQRPLTRSFDVSFDLRLKYGWANNREAGDLRRHCAHYDVTVMIKRLTNIIKYVGWCTIWYDSIDQVLFFHQNRTVIFVPFLALSMPAWKCCQ